MTSPTETTSVINRHRDGTAARITSNRARRSAYRMIDLGTIRLDLTVYDLIADLDPGWLAWRDQLDGEKPSQKIAA